MQADNQTNMGRSEIRQHTGQTALSAFIAAVFMFFFGFFYAYEGVFGSDLYIASVSVFTWTLRIGGGVMLISALQAGRVGVTR